MNISPEEAQLFFKLYFALLAFANRELNVVPDVSKADDIRKTEIERTQKIREALFKHPQLVDRFADENPEGFLPEELEIIRSWKHRVSGEFYLLRYLKKYAVLMSTKEADHLYGVLGLYDSFDTLLGGQPLPVLLKTTLLPFKGQIICDGIIASNSVLFGPGIRGELDDTYKRLKQKEGIIEQLASPEGEPAVRTSLNLRTAKPAPDWKPTIQEIVQAADKMRRAAAHLALAAFDEPSETGDELRQVRRALTRVENLRHVEDF